MPCAWNGETTPVCAAACGERDRGRLACSQALVHRAEQFARGVIGHDDGRGDHAARTGVEPDSRHARSPPRPTAPTIARPRTTRAPRSRAPTRHEIDVVAEQRAVGELETREQRIVDGVASVGGDMQHVDLRCQVGDGIHRRLAVERSASVQPCRCGSTSSSPRATRGPTAKPAVSARARAARACIHPDADDATVNGRPRRAGSIVHGSPESTPGAVRTIRAHRRATARGATRRPRTARRGGRLAIAGRPAAIGPELREADTSRSARRPASSARPARPVRHVDHPGAGRRGDHQVIRARSRHRPARRSRRPARSCTSASVSRCSWPAAPVALH